MELTQKLELKEQAKQLLLKGCYKMSMNKYLRLIEAGSQGFQQRDWAIVHLNTAICMQFLDRLDDALEKVNQSITIDPTYQKAYYRRLQILQEQGNFKAALHEQSIPSFIYNEEISQLKNRILQQYTKTLGLSSLLQKLKDKNFMANLGDEVNKFAQGGYQSVFQAIIAQISSQNIFRPEIQSALSQHYCFLKESNDKNWVQSFCKGIKEILLTLKAKNVQNSSQQTIILHQFWQNYQKLYCKTNKQSLFIVKKSTSKQYQQSLISFYPFSKMDSQLFLDILHSALSINHQVIDSDRLVHFLSHTKVQIKSANMTKIKDIQQKCTHILQKQLSIVNIAKYEKLKIIIDSVFAGLVVPNLKEKQINNFHTLYCYGRQKLNKYDQIVSAILNYFAIQRDKLEFSQIFIISELLQTVPLSFISQNKPIRSKIYQFICSQLEKMSFNGTLQNTMKICLLLSLLISVDPLKNILQNHQISKTISDLWEIKNTITIVKQQKKNDFEVQARISIYLRTLSLLASTQNLVLFKIYEQTQKFCDILHELSESNRKQGENITWIYQIKYLQAVVRLLYLLTVDLSALQESQLADRMGVSQIEIAKARKLQGEIREKEEQIANMRLMFVKNCCSSDKWAMIILKLASLYHLLTKNNIKIPHILHNFVYIFKQLSNVENRKFYHPNIIKIMLKPQNQTLKYNSGIFFSKITKQSNPSMFEFKDLQAISDSLIYLVKQAKHQIHAFQALLGLISLSSSSIKVNISVIEDNLLQQNQYIMHAALQLLNNMLIIYGQDGNGSGLQRDKYLDKLSKRISNIVHKYYLAYRQQIISQSTSKGQKNMSYNDYSHPLKIYGTLISVLMLLDTIKPLLQQNSLKLAYHSHEVKQLFSWDDANRILSQKWVREADLSMTLFKLAMHHCEKLPAKWYAPYMHWIGALKNVDHEKWAKLQKYIH